MVFYSAVGYVIKILGQRKIKSEPVFNSSRLISEENKNDNSIHTHLRNLRLEFSKSEFELFSRHINNSLNALNKQKGVNADDGRDGGLNSYFILNEIKIPSSPVFNHNCLEVQLNKAGKIHLHYRDLRIDFSKEEFIEFAEVLQSSLLKLKE